MYRVDNPEPLFIDKNGLEISFIEQKEPSINEVSQNSESDQEILKFVFGGL